MNPANNPTRSLPSAYESEQAILSLVLQHADLALPKLAWITPDHFHMPSHGEMWKTIQEMAEGGKPLDLVSVTQRLMDKGTLEAHGGPGAIAEIFNIASSPASLDHYAGTVAEKFRRRVGLKVAADVAAAFWDESTPVNDALVAAQEKLFSLQKKEGGRQQFRDAKTVVLEAIDGIQAAIKRRGHVTVGVASGFTDIDRTHMGLKPREVTILGGRPGNGKSALMLNIAENVALGCGHFPEFDQPPAGVLLVGLEMSDVQNMKRMILGRAGVDIRRMRDGFVETKAKDANVNKTQLRDIIEAGNALAATNFHLLDTSGLDITTLASLLRQKCQHANIKLVIVDYLQLLKSKSKAAQSSRYVEIGDISRGIKDIAKQLDVHMLVGAQLGRDADREAGPRISDLRESGDIEQDADNVWLIDRPFKRATDNQKMNEDDDEIYCDLPAKFGTNKDGSTLRVERARLLIAKQRDGPNADIDLAWRPEITRFSSTTTKLFTNNADERQQ